MAPLPPPPKAPPRGGRLPPSPPPNSTLRGRRFPPLHDPHVESGTSPEYGDWAGASLLHPSHRRSPPSLASRPPSRLSRANSFRRTLRANPALARINCAVLRRLLCTRYVRSHRNKTKTPLAKVREES